MTDPDKMAGSRPDRAAQQLAKALRANLGRRKIQQRERRKRALSQAENNQRGDTLELDESAGASRQTADSADSV